MTICDDTRNPPDCQEDAFHGPDCHVYVIGFDLDKSPSKVGIASDPTKRIATLQTAHHQRLILAGSWRLPEREIARSLEAAFHATQKRDRLAGEWFDMTPEQCMCILHIGLGVMLNKVYLLEPDQVEEVLARSRNWPSRYHG